MDCSSVLFITELEQVGESVSLGWEAMQLLSQCTVEVIHPPPSSRTSSFAPRFPPQPSDACQPSIKSTPSADWLCYRINSGPGFQPTCTLTSSLLVLSPHPHCVHPASQILCPVLVIYLVGSLITEALS